MAAAFDTLKAATRLREEAGFEERQATVLVELFADRYGDRENLATRDDVAAVRGEVHKQGQLMTTRLGAAIAAAVAIIVALDKLL